MIPLIHWRGKKLSTAIFSDETFNHHWDSHKHLNLSTEETLVETLCFVERIVHTVKESSQRIECLLIEIRVFVKLPANC